MTAVGGEYQGACIPFVFKRLGAGVNRLVFDDNGTLWVGFTGRGWSSGEGLKKITYTGVGQALAPLRRPRIHSARPRSRSGCALTSLP